MSEGTEVNSECLSDPLMKRQRRWKNVALCAGACLVGIPAGFVACQLHVIHADAEQLNAIMAEIDAKDPNGWRFTDLEAQRPVIAEDQDSAIHIQKVLELLPDLKKLISPNHIYLFLIVLKRLY